MRSIRRMTPGDLEACVDVWVRARWSAQPLLEDQLGYGDDQNLAYFRDHVAVDCEVWVACEGSDTESDDRVVGLVALGHGTIDQLHVGPDHQSKGVGMALLAHAKEQRPTGISLFTFQRNERARRFYERNGFVVVRLGVSPPPENEPDVEYRWLPETHVGE